MTRQDLKILTWNANGLGQYKEELQVFLNNSNIDIGLITETHLTNQSYIKIPGYKLYHTIHPQNTARGGSAVIIKDNLPHYEEKQYQSASIQATSVKIKTANYNIMVCAAYFPPRYNLTKEEYLQFLKTLGQMFILGGDFNAKHTHWGSRLVTKKGKELLKAIMQYGCNYHSTGMPTYWPTDQSKIPDLLDFFITKKISTNFVSVEECFDLSSDHSPVILTLSENLIKKEVNPHLTNKTTDWESFKSDLSKRIYLGVPLQTTKQLEAECEKNIIDIQQAAWNNTYIAQKKLVGHNYPKEIKELVAEKRRARKKWQQTRAPTDKNKLNKLTQQLRREIERLKDESIESYLRNLTADKDTNYSLWKATKKIKRPILQIPPIKDRNGLWVRDNKSKAQVFADHLEETFKPYSSSSKPSNEYKTETTIKDISLRHVTPKEVEQEIRKNINAKKAPGFDLITGQVLKNLPRKAIVKLTNIMNAAFRLKHVPSVWKVSEVVMIPKPGKPPHQPSSYRPISLLTTISKLFEKLLLKRIKPLIEEKELIPTHQFGFRNHHSTLEQVHRITDVIEKALEDGHVCSAVFLDIAQAFDKVWHNGLLNKLRKLLPKNVTELIESYLCC